MTGGEEAEEPSSDRLAREDRQLAMDVALHQLAIDAGLDQKQRRDARKVTDP